MVESQTPNEARSKTLSSLSSCHSVYRNGRTPRLHVWQMRGVSKLRTRLLSLRNRSYLDREVRRRVYRVWLSIVETCRSDSPTSIDMLPRHRLPSPVCPNPT